MRVARDQQEVQGNDAGDHRDPEDRRPHDEAEIKEKMLDKTVADSFPASDPPSSIPDPDADSFPA